METFCKWIDKVVIVISVFQIISCNYISNGTPSNESLLKMKIIPKEYTYFSNSYYKFHKQVQTWADARQICDQEGGHLVIINSEDEAQLLITLMARYKGSFKKAIGSKSFIHIGLHSLFKAGEWVTIDGKSLESSGYNFWKPNEPNNFHGHENCGSFYRDGGLNDIQCHFSFPFICEIPVDNCNNLLIREEMTRNGTKLYTYTVKNFKQKNQGIVIDNNEIL